MSNLLHHILWKKYLPGLPQGETISNLVEVSTKVREDFTVPSLPKVPFTIYNTIKTLHYDAKWMFEIGMLVHKDHK